MAPVKKLLRRRRSDDKHQDSSDVPPATSASANIVDAMQSAHNGVDSAGRTANQDGIHATGSCLSSAAITATTTAAIVTPNAKLRGQQAKCEQDHFQHQDQQDQRCGQQAEPPTATQPHSHSQQRTQLLAQTQSEAPEQQQQPQQQEEPQQEEPKKRKRRKAGKETKRRGKRKQRHASSVDTESSANVTPSSGRRRSSRGNSSLSELARDIVVHRKNVVFITGAGISVASGVRPFRGKSGVWTNVIWTTATREAFRKNPLDWYNQFWLPFLEMPNNPTPNAGHAALAALLDKYPNIDIITQNVDGLHTPAERLIEAHGRLGLFKCMPHEDSDTDSDSDDDNDRPVHLGHRRKSRTSTSPCHYRKAESLSITQLLPRATSKAFATKKRSIQHAPKCPSCGNAVAPQALLFDEGYHAHRFYQFERMENMLAKADVIVFCGTSFAVRLTVVALDHARDFSLPVYNFNTQDLLQPSLRLNAENITGKSEQTLPLLLQACQQMEDQTMPRAFRTAPAAATSTPSSSTTNAPATPSSSSPTAPISVGS